MSTSASGNSGKLFIVGVFVVALATAGASWWFRYSATHRALQFWGPTAARLIRDAPRVTLRSEDANTLPRDISTAHGLTHLRTALLEDRSYDWSAAGPPNTNWSNSLVFEETEGAEPRVVILLSPDFNWAANGSAADPAGHAISTSPIAKGLETFFHDESQQAPSER